MYALILAGGRGERLKPLTDTMPKPMVPVRGTPILGHQLFWLRREGITDIVILCSYRWEAIRDHFGDGREFGLGIQYSVEESPLGRGGGLRQGLGMVPDTEQTVVALNGDVLTNQPLEPLLKLHRDSGATATLMLTPYPSAYGVLETDDTGRVLSFVEKGTLPHWIHAGVDVFERAIREELPELGDHETMTLPGMARQGRLYAHRSDAFWSSIDGFKDLKAAEESLPEATPGGQGS